MRSRSLGRGLIAAIALAGCAVPALAADLSCTGALGAPARTEGPLRTLGGAPALAHFAAVPGHAYLVQVDERDNDALVEVLDSQDQILARADHPERRTGTRRAVVTAPDSGSLLVRVTGKENTAAVGTATIQVFDLAVLRKRPECLAIVKALAEADAGYAAGQEISGGRSTSYTGHARGAFLRAAQGYTTAERALDATTDQPLSGQTALALAGINYFDLQDWAQAAEWAQVAARTLASDEPYRRARADALLAAAWIEIGSAAPAGRAVTGSRVDTSELLARARQLLLRLLHFHLQRGERYDAGLQLANIGVTYFDQGNYLECVRASAAAGRLFGSIHELQRRALARQNQALCLWGLGQLHEALDWFEHALSDIGPEPYPSMYLIVLTNTALAEYALGHIDESLQLYDRALAFAQQVQSAREEAYCLYGIGVNYYALGDRQRAREFLERSLAIRTVALDGRGRMASLRALATIDAEQGRVEEALALDREALGLAIAPSAIARIEIQQAAHTAAAGRPAEAQALLDEVLATYAKADPLIQAEALLQRAEILRPMGRAGEALADLAAARAHLHAFGSVMEEFEGDLELARALRQVGQPDAALAAVDRALRQSDAVRLQTANPELRAQLQTPLRPAYDLKLELLRERYEQASAMGRKRLANTLAAVAFATADASRAHSFADIAAQNYSPAVRRALAAELRHREQLYRELSARRFALDARLERSRTDDSGVRYLVTDIADLRRQVDTVNTAIASRTTNGAGVRADRERMSFPSLPAHTALVEYWLGSESAYAWVVLPGELHWQRLSSPRAIASQAAAFHHSLTRLVDMPVERRLEDASSLYTMIIRPLEPWLARVRNWVVVPDGALDYVPFAALHDREAHPESFVAMQHDVAVTPAAWMLGKSHGQAALPEERKILLVADPVYQADDPRLAAFKAALAAAQTTVHRAPDPARQDYRRLRFTAEEAAGISAQFQSGDVEELIGVNATRERLLALDWSQYRFIHIATHGIVDAQVPELSALILGSYDARGGEVADRAVRVADVSLKTLRAEVAVLSACDTALGTEVRSEGLVGMSSTMLARGARAVVASLWPVPDESGARLMTKFYQHMLGDSMGPVAALSTAMRSMASQEASADPALWAAFQVSVAAVRSPLINPRPAPVKVAETETSQ